MRFKGELSLTASASTGGSYQTLRDCGSESLPPFEVPISRNCQNPRNSRHSDLSFTVQEIVRNKYRRITERTIRWFDCHPAVVLFKFSLPVPGIEPLHFYVQRLLMGWLWSPWLMVAVQRKGMCKEHRPGHVAALLQFPYYWSSA
jgi:hypothetical protein